MTDSAFAHLPATIRVGDFEVCRMGFGAMRLPGPQVWGPPSDPARARQVVRRAVELGVQFIDTSWYYGPFVANQLLAEVLHPYRKELVIATKLGGTRHADSSWQPFNRPEQLREGCENDLRTLKREQLDVVHLRYMHTQVPFADMVGTFLDLQREGKIRHIGLSNVTARQIGEAQAAGATVVSVQNMFTVPEADNPMGRAVHAQSNDGVLELCEAQQIAFTPYFPLAVGGVDKHPKLIALSRRLGRSPAQITLAWMLAKSKVLLPIPGTGSPAHLEENWAAREIRLGADEVREIG
jgi:pyridoxine 4-dehydrogenase